jgi:hypothetical protein
MPLCKECRAKALVIETRRKSSGDVYRRFQCTGCNERWTVWNGEKPLSTVPEVRLSDEAILDILTDKSAQPVLAERHGCSMSAVGQIRRGELHANVHPEVPRLVVRPRAPRKSCKRCIHYTKNKEQPCGLGHKDPIEEGLTFALYCSNFVMDSEQQ